MDFLSLLLNFTEAIPQLVSQYGTWIYLILFLIIFSETGLVIAAFLPGDSFLFMIGAVCGLGSLNLTACLILLTIAAILGNISNYFIGKFFGKYMIEKQWVDAKSLEKTHAFFEKHGGKTIVLSRFLPIFRTFSPFVAGLSVMDFKLFNFYNILGAVIWIHLFVLAGYFLGKITWVQQNLEQIVLIGFLAAFIPMLIGLAMRFFRKK